MRRAPRVIKVKKNCIFCKEKTNPDYKEIALLKKYVSERGKIVGRGRSGVCAKHQRRVTLAIKKARFLALLPFVGGL
ncbi:30S ribosomal protein S18 [Candidatus Gottesmanbacteria bacterium]|nr:30S ribosomal protein S18 [Candidatus Gottesmanbacteria bacterium]